MWIFAIAGILASSTLLLRLPIFLLPFWLLALLAIGISYASSQSLWVAVAGFLLFAAFIGMTAAFTALYIARTYKNGLQRPNAYIDHYKSRLHPSLDANDAQASVGQVSL